MTTRKVVAHWSIPAACALFCALLLNGEPVLAQSAMPQAVASVTKPELVDTVAHHPEVPTTPRTKPVDSSSANRIAEVGFGTLRFDGLMQVQYVVTDSKTPSTFRIRRAELKVAGKVSPRVSWSMMFDVSKALSLNSSTGTVDGSTVVTGTSVNQSSRLMQDALLIFDVSSAFHIDAGQFRLPLGGVGSAGSSSLETIERPMFQSDRARNGTLGDVRDVGVVARGAVGKLADYWVGAFNGSGESMNSVDTNNQKPLVARVLFRTVVPGLRVGASGVLSGIHAVSALRKDRLGAEVVYARKAYLARVEVQDGKDGPFDRLGGFLLLGLRASRALQLVTRLDVYDPDTDRDDTAATARAVDVMAGATWFIVGDNAKLQVNASRRSFANDIAPKLNQLQLSLQAAW